MKKTGKLPHRSDVQPEDCWNLTSLFATDDQWETAFARWETQAEGYDEFRGKLATNPKTLARCLDFDNEFDRLAERLGAYAFLKTAEDTANPTYQRMMGRFRHVARLATERASYLRPEILALPRATMERFLKAKSLEPHRLTLERLWRYKPHTLSKREEKLLAMQAEVSHAPQQIFQQLNDADLKFGMVRKEDGTSVELSHATFSSLLQSRERKVRRTAFRKYYAQFEAHENTFAASLAGSLHTDIYQARARGYKSALAASLFSDDVPETVYDNLISSVRRNLPTVHRYYQWRRRAMKISRIHFYDTYVPIFRDRKKQRPWNEAVSLCLDSLNPLGKEYVRGLREGLEGGWCDRYPNRGKQSGAFSYGTFDAQPYIMMNYQPDVLDHVFTLAHEAGHSMHSYYSAKHQPFQYYNYTIFVAEVASTFNEQLLSHYLLKHAKNRQERAYLLNREIDSVRATLIRQTMFAEFEKRTHEMVESGEPATTESFKKIYRELLEAYLGPEFTIDDELSLECLRIPHFYRAFYVYKYATGMSAAIALAQGVLEGGKSELDAYLGFLRGGCSKYPLDLLRDAGVDMEQPEPVDRALAYLDDLVTQLEDLKPEN